MSKNLKLTLIILVAVLFVIVGFVFLRGEKGPAPAAENNNVVAAPPVQDPVDIAKLEEGYKKDMAVIFNNCDSLVESENADEAALNSEKDKILGMTVPPGYRDFHLKLVMAIEKMDKFLEAGDESGKLAAVEMMRDLKDKNAWLAK